MRHYLEKQNSNAPCDECQNAKLCGEQKKACDAFAFYALNDRQNDSLSKNPTFSMYYDLMEVNDHLTILKHLAGQLKRETA